MTNDFLPIDLNYGIQRIFSFGITPDETDKNQLIGIEKETSASIVKIESLGHSKFVLISNGQVYSKGTQYIGREIKNENEKYIYKQIKFHDNNKNNVLIFNITTGKNHILALDSDHNVWGWGSNLMKQINPIEPESRNPTFEFPHKILYLEKSLGVIQIFAISDTSIAVMKGNNILMWGSSFKGIMGKTKNKNSSNENSHSFFEKANITECIKTEILKDNSDYTEKYFNSKKLFNTNFNQIMKDNVDKIEEIKVLQYKKNSILDDNLNIDSVKKKFEKYTITNKNIDMLTSRIEYFDELIKVSKVKQENIIEKIKILEQEIGLLRLDNEKICKELSEMRSTIEIKNSKRNNLTNILNESSNNEEKGILKREIKDFSTDIHKLTTYEESYNNNLQIIIGSLDQKNNELSKISSQLLKLSEDLILHTKFKLTLEDMIVIINEYYYKNNNENKLEHKKSKLIGGERKDLFQILVFKNKLIDDSSFINLNQNFLKHKKNLSTDALIIESNSLLEMHRTEFIDLFKSLTEQDKITLSTIIDMTENKIKLIFEQNKLIQNLNLMFKNLPGEVVEYYENKHKKEDETVNVYSNMSKNERNLQKLYTSSKDTIISFLNEVVESEEKHDKKIISGHNDEGKTNLIVINEFRPMNLPEKVEFNIKDLDIMKLKTFPKIQEKTTN